MIASKPRSRRPVRTQVSGRAHDSARTVRGNAGMSGAPGTARASGERFWANGCDHETSVTSCPACARWWAKALVCPATAPLPRRLGPTMASLRAEPPTPAEPVTSAISATAGRGLSAAVTMGHRGCTAGSFISRLSLPSESPDVVLIDGPSRHVPIGPNGVRAHPGFAMGLRTSHGIARRLASVRTPASVLAEILRSDPARPRVTFYEDTTGPTHGEGPVERAPVGRQGQADD